MITCFYARVNPILRLNFTILRTCLSGDESEDCNAWYSEAGLVCRDWRTMRNLEFFGI
jgi:hypothetical protein